jgi:ABC-2 type transport system ATP-binding protein
VNLPAGIDPTLLLLLVPLLLLQLGLLVFSIVDLLREDRRVRGGNKGVWAVIIVFVNLIGPILYLLVGREEGVPDPVAPAPGAMPGWGSPHDPPVAERPAEPLGLAARSPAAPAAAAGIGGAMTPAPVLEREEPAGRPPAAVGAPARSAIRLEGLTRRYGGGVLALDGLTLDVPENAVFGLLGPNGAGKTTTLRLLAGLTRPTAGRAVVAGVVVADEPLVVRRGLGYLEQDPRAYLWMTGREQLTMLGRLHGLDGEPLRASVAAALARVGLADAADRRTGTYSGGMRQRLGIAGALVHRPRIIVLDEPVSALDPEGRRDVLALIASLRGEATVLFSTHVLADVERICDRVAILDRGRLVVEGPLGELLDRFARPVYRVEGEPGESARLDALALRLRDLAWVTGAAVEHGVLTVAVSDPAVAARELLGEVAASGIAVVSVARDRPTLEDVFLHLTGRVGEAAA